MGNKSGKVSQLKLGRLPGHDRLGKISLCRLVGEQRVAGDRFAGRM